MSGLRRCEQCGDLFRIKNDGPEAMRADGTFPKHVCPKCKAPKAEHLRAETLEEENTRLRAELFEALGYVPEYFRKRHFSKYCHPGTGDLRSDALNPRKE